MVINSDGYFGFLAKQSACLLGGCFLMVIQLMQLPQAS